MSEIANQFQTGDDRANLNALRGSIGGLMGWSQEWIKKRFANNPNLNDMIGSFDFAIQCLSHEQSESRLLALLVIDTFFPSVDISSYLPRFEELAYRDANPKIRQEAISIVARIASRGSMDFQKATGKKIVSIVNDNSERPEVRKTAYQSLCTLSPDFDVRMRSFEVHFPDDVDWDYVRSWQ